jgi:hypothetical protein
MDPRELFFVLYFSYIRSVLFWIFELRNNLGEIDG